MTKPKLLMLFFPTVSLADAGDISVPSIRPAMRMKRYMKLLSRVLILDAPGRIENHHVQHTFRVLFPGQKTPDLVSPEFLHSLNDEEELMKSMEGIR